MLAVCAGGGEVVRRRVAAHFLLVFFFSHLKPTFHQSWHSLMSRRVIAD